MTFPGKPTVIARTDWKRPCRYCGGPIKAGQEITKSTTYPAHVECLVAEVEREVARQNEKGTRAKPARRAPAKYANKAARRLEVLAALADLTAQHGYAPTLGELAAALGLTKSGTYYHLLWLREAGDLDFAPRKARTLRITAQGRWVLEAAQASAPFVIDLATGESVLGPAQIDDWRDTWPFRVADNSAAPAQPEATTARESAQGECRE